MKRITLNKIKNPAITIQSILEEVMPSEEDPRIIEDVVKSTLDELNKLEEALFYKQEKLNTENLKFNDYDFRALTLKEKINLKKSENIKFILKLQSEHQNLLILQRFLNFYDFLRNNLEINFDDLINEKVENKEFVCFCLSQIKNDIFLSSRTEDLKEKMEKHLIMQFEENLEDMEVLKNTYKCSFYLNEGYPLIKIYVNSIEVLQNPLFLELKEKTSLNLDDFKLQEEFVDFIKKIENFYAENAKLISFVFYDRIKVINQINKRIFEDILASNLDTLLSTKNPFLYIYNLQHSFKLIESLCNTIKLHFDEFNSNLYLEDLYNPYFSLLHLKEKGAFDEIFDFYIVNKQLSCNYFLLNENLRVTNDYKKIFKILIFLTENIIKRFFNYLKSANGDEYFEHFLRRFNEFINQFLLITSNQEVLELIENVTEYYFVLKKLFYKVKVTNFEILENFYSECAQKLFEKKTVQANFYVKKLFYSLSYSEYTTNQPNTQTILTLIAFLNQELLLSKKHLEGKNATKYLISLLKYVYTSFYKKILTFKFGKEAIVLYEDAKLLLIFSKTNVPDTVKSFEYLLEITQLISINKKDVRAYYLSIFEKIPELEAKKILKCRIDYRTVKWVLNVGG